MRNFSDLPNEYDADDITVVLVDFSKPDQKGGTTRKVRRRKRHTKKAQGQGHILPKTFMI